MEIGISEAAKLTEEETRLQHWLNIGNHGEMDYMQNHFEKRIDPSELVPGAKSVILLYNYYTDKNQLRAHSKYPVMLMVRIIIVFLKRN